MKLRAYLLTMTIDDILLNTHEDVLLFKHIRYHLQFINILVTLILLA